MQETYIRISTNASKYIPAGKPMVWIFQIAKNLAYMEIRSKSREQLTDYQESNPEYGAATVELLDESIVNTVVLKNALTHLDEIERQILILHAVAGLKQREIALITEKPLGTILWKYNQALKKMRMALSKKG